MTDESPEAQLINSFNQQAGNVPLLNRSPAHPHRTSTTGYRSSGTNLRDAIEFITNLESLPLNVQNKPDPRVLDNAWDGKGCMPSELFRRGMLELTAQAFLEDSYPEWFGDAVDYANDNLELMMALNSVRTQGWDEFLNWACEPMPADDAEYNEDSFWSMNLEGMAFNKLIPLLHPDLKEK